VIEEALLHRHVVRRLRAAGEVEALGGQVGVDGAGVARARLAPDELAAFERVDDP
jgi:hypothetical protein